MDGSNLAGFLSFSKNAGWGVLGMNLFCIEDFRLAKLRNMWIESKMGVFILVHSMDFNHFVRLSDLYIYKKNQILFLSKVIFF